MDKKSEGKRDREGEPQEGERPREPNPPSTPDSAQNAGPLPFPRRKKLPHGINHTFDGPTIVFLTVCTHQRRRCLANEHCCRLLLNVWSEATFWLVGRYVIMPDHVHLFAALAEPDYDFDAWVKYWKRLFTQRVKLADFRWQTDHWDTRMRTDRQYAEKWEYVRENPVRHGLVAEPEMWPFAGEVNEFGW